MLATGFTALALLPLVVAVLSGLEPAGRWAELASGLGLVAGAVLLLQFLSSGRFETVSSRIGIDRTMGFHRLSALFLVAAALLHPLLYAVPVMLTDPAAAPGHIAGTLASGRLRSGVGALVLIGALVAMGVWRDRLPMRYERWRLLHGPVAVLAAALVLHHAMAVGTYSSEPMVRAAWIGLAGLAALSAVIVYVVRPLRMHRGGWQVESVRRVATNIVELTLRAASPGGFTFRGGQFVWLTIAPHRPPLHDHPFSIASAPADLPRLRFLVREAGDCTEGFRDLAAGTPVAIDGPHGSFVLPGTGDAVVLVAGGVGIAPILGLLEEAASRGDRRPFRLLYGARDPESIVARERLASLALRLDLAVTCHADTARGADGGSPAASGPMSSRDIERLVAGLDAGAAEAMVCGPPAMMAAVTDALLRAGFRPAAIHYERFDYGSGSGRLDRRRRARVVAVLCGLVAAAVVFALR